MIFGRNVEQDEMRCCVQERQLAFLFLELSPLLVVNLNLCPFCNSSTFWIIFIFLGRNVEQDKMGCCLQE